MVSQLERIQEASRLNNVGAMYLANADAGSAVKAFKTSLSIMEGVAGEAESESLCSPSSAQSLSRSCPSIDIPGLEDTFFIYNRAILLDASTETDLTFSNAVILFNLALAFHQRGRAFGDIPKLQKALYLYNVSSKLVTDMSSSTSSGALVLAAMNNQAQILFGLGDYEQARELLERMRSLAEVVPTPTEDDKVTSTFARYHFDEFYLNVAIAQPPTTAPSA